MSITTNPEPYLGIDEAGRGPVIGPLVVGVVKWGNGLAEKSNELVVRDSKDMTNNQRVTYRNLLDEAATYTVQFIPAHILANSSKNIQEIQAEVMADIIQQYKCKNIVADATGSDNVHAQIKNDCLSYDILFEEKADEKYRGVSAASVLAKTARDAAIEEIKKKYGNIGSGYPSDSQTREWLKDWKSKNDYWPPIVRTNWETINRLND